MDNKEYAEILRTAFQMQISYINKELNEDSCLNVDYLQGVKEGLQIAIGKIEASAFLTE